jgi:hypothetical protein
MTGMLHRYQHRRLRFNAQVRAVMIAACSMALQQRYSARTIVATPSIVSLEYEIKSSVIFPSAGLSVHRL